MRSVCVLSGGGAKGSFQVGVLKKLYEQGKDFSAFYGTSVGALNSASMAYQSVGKLEEFWLGIKSQSDALSFNWNFLWKQGIYNLNPLRKSLEKLTSVDPIREAIACKVNLITGAKEYVNNHDFSVRDFIDGVLASASMPVIMEPVGNCVDGGVREQTPLMPAIQEGADQITVILCNPFVENLQDKFTMPSGFLPFIGVGTRSLDIMEHEIFIQDIKKCLAYNQLPGKKHIDLQVYAPSTILMDTLEFNPLKIKGAIDLGYQSQAIVIGS